MILGQFLKQPDEVKDYDINYKPWLNSTDDEDTLREVTVKSIECLDDPEDTSLECDLVLHTIYESKFWMSGGTSGYVYKLSVYARTEKGRIDESELIFAIEDI